MYVWRGLTPRLSVDIMNFFVIHTLKQYVRSNGAFRCRRKYYNSGEIKDSQWIKACESVTISGLTVGRS